MVGGNIQGHFQRECKQKMYEQRRNRPPFNTIRQGQRFQGHGYHNKSEDRRHQGHSYHNRYNNVQDQGHLFDNGQGHSYQNRYQDSYTQGHQGYPNTYDQGQSYQLTHGHLLLSFLHYSYISALIYNINNLFIIIFIYSDRVSYKIVDIKKYITRVCFR